MNKTIEVQALEQALKQFNENIDKAEFRNSFIQGLKQAIMIIEEAQKPLTVSSGKERELQFLTQISEACGEGSYLHTLLSEELVTWASKMIGAGVPPDVMTNWNETLKEHHDMLSSTLELSNRLVDSQNDVKHLEMLLTQQRNDLQLTTDELVQSYDRELAEKSDRLVGMTNQWQTAHAELQTLRKTSSNQHTIILLLKAEVYDLTHRRED